eukprot:7446414-Pyramimonas_sp.AAC.1
MGAPHPFGPLQTLRPAPAFSESPRGHCRIFPGRGEWEFKERRPSGRIIRTFPNRAPRDAHGPAGIGPSALAFVV